MEDSQKFDLYLQLAEKKSVEELLRYHGHQFEKRDFEKRMVKDFIHFPNY